MDVFLRIVGILALLVVAGLGAIALFLWWHWRKIKLGLAAGAPPLTIELIDDPAPEWLQQEPFVETIRDFQALDFTAVGPFEVVGIAGVRVLGFCHPTSGVFGCCYNHPLAGCFIDLCATLADGLELTVTNAPAGGEMETRPDTEKVFLRGQPLTELYATLLVKIAGRALKPCPPERFKEDFTGAYARDMAWRANKLGTSEAEFRRVAANGKETYTEEQLTAAFTQTKLQELRLWSAGAAEEFARTSDLSVARWKEFEHRLVIFREDFHPAALLEYIGESIDIPAEKGQALRAELATGLPVARLLDKVAEATGCSFIHLGRVERPIRCELYGLQPPR